MEKPQNITSSEEKGGRSPKQTDQTKSRPVDRNGQVLEFSEQFF